MQEATTLAQRELQLASLVPAPHVSAPAAGLTARVTMLEEQVLGSAQPGSLPDRVKVLEAVPHIRQPQTGTV